VSATGLFKIAFPWATVEEMKTERVFVKTLNGVDHEEIAGNTWVAVETGQSLTIHVGVGLYTDLLRNNSFSTCRGLWLERMAYFTLSSITYGVEG